MFYCLYCIACWHRLCQLTPNTEIYELVLRVVKFDRMQDSNLSKVKYTAYLDYVVELALQYRPIITLRVLGAAY